jgi:hypothetical protein
MILVALLVGCADENDVEGTYRVTVRNGDDGCGFGWTPGGGFSAELTIATYQSESGEKVVAALQSTPSPAFPHFANNGFTGSLIDGELIIYGGGTVETAECYYLGRVEIRADYRPNRFVNLHGGIWYELNVWTTSPGCAPRCVSYQDLEGEQY